MTPPRSEQRILVGLMSGTSLDGISAAVVRFDRGSDGRVTYDLLGMSVRAYDAAQRERLARALVGVTPREYCRLSFDLGDWLADAAITAIAEAGVDRDSVAAIASHGQTVWHEPGHSTWQFGQPAVIAERTGISVISDFRVRDVAAAGQGAPLVPAADALLFAHATEWRALQNLGGIGNVTIVPPGGVRESTRACRTTKTAGSHGPGTRSTPSSGTFSPIPTSRARRPNPRAASCSIPHSSRRSSSGVGLRKRMHRPAISWPRPSHSQPRALQTRFADLYRSRCASSSSQAAGRRIPRSWTP